MDSIWDERVRFIAAMRLSGLTNSQVAEFYGVTLRTIKNRMGERGIRSVMEAMRSGKIARPTQDEIEASRPRATLEDVAKLPDYKASVEIMPDGSHKSDKLLRMSEKQAKDVDFLLAAHGYDKEKWTLTGARSNIWNSYSKQDGIMTLYSSQITVKPRNTGKSDEEWQRFFTQLGETFQSPVHTPTRHSKDGKMLEINVADLHIGKLSWTGDSNDTYNHEIARERFFYVLNDALTRTQDYSFEKILFVWSNDWFHVDGPSKSTTKGTPQDVSMQFEHMFEYGCEMLVQGMDLLNQVAPLITLYTASNHDRLTSFFATHYLAAWYRNNAHVTVDSRPLSRKAVRFGANLLGLTHGHLEKKEMGSWMASEYRKDWGETFYHEVHAAHNHREMVVEESNGQITRYTSSPTGTDRWHHDGTYTGAIQKAQTFIWDRDYGLENTLNTIVRPEGPNLKSALAI